LVVAEVAEVALVLLAVVAVEQEGVLAVVGTPQWGQLSLLAVAAGGLVLAARLVGQWQFLQ
jgi:hypothetical protein